MARVQKVQVPVEEFRRRRAALARQWAGRVLASRKNAGGPHGRRGYSRPKKKAQDRSLMLQEV